ncbi:response regulator [Paenibacillus eucommiae]|uniref:histidine kinase n=1 Tax=Paenibacillus eucommiae TaxID=1355755 RepID=A0ABS4J713_9BACL|nr:response regulator [Paenibacillus eucommiae]MBP1995647.1 CheY-like chemotaxis protein/methyl-accepting chemotaxis protein [Paenibacillus eucommiae]
MKWVKNAKINSKLIVMVLIPMLGVFYFSITSIYEKIHDNAAINQLEILTDLAVDTNAMIHELQKERGLVSGYLGKQASTIKVSMMDQREETNRKITELENSLKSLSADGYGVKFVQDLENAVRMLHQLSEERELIDTNKTDVNASLAYYRGTIDAFFHVMQNLNLLSSNPEISRMLSAYINFSRMKSAVSQERALLANIFSNDQLTLNDIEQTKLSEQEQTIYFNVFSSFAAPEALSQYKAVVKGQAVNEVGRIRLTVIEGASGDITETDSEYWYNVITEKIDLFKIVEDDFSNQLIAKMRVIQDKALNSLVFVISLNFIILVFSIAIIMLVSRMLLKQIGLLKQSTELILRGETDVEAEVLTKDEFGDLTKAFNQMVASFRDVILQADQISKGDYELTITPRSDRDRLSIALTQMLTSLKDTKAENERQFWLKTQLARLTGMSQGVIKLQQLVSMLIAEIAGLVEAGQAVFYVKEVEKGPRQESEFVLLGSYAYKERKNLANRFRKGEGLVGQCALEKKPILLSNVPDDYIHISSGLGESKPLNILVLPIMFEEEVVAVMELASFQGFTPIQQDLLDQLTTSLGVVLDSVSSRQLTEELLDESRQLAEELRTQQEELRTANEELEEQTNMLRKSEEKMKIQSEELQAINEELEEKTNYLELQKTDIEKQNQMIQISKKEIEIKAEELELASKYKSEFLANMSHELRTPLNSLLILSKSLAKNEEGNLSEDQIESANVIYSGGQDLLTLINDILDLSKVEAGKLNIHKEEVRFDSIVRNLQYQFNPVARDKGLQFAIKLEADIPESLVTDGHRTEQILKNLLSNAFKFTPAGSVTLRIYKPKQDEGLYRGGPAAVDMIALSVKDTGVGIAEDKQRAIFEAFQQADGSTSRRYGGTGLGLTISRQLAKLLGGEIHLQSVPEQGSTFTLYLPAASENESLKGTGAQEFVQPSPPAEVTAIAEAFAGEAMAAAASEPGVESGAEPSVVKKFVEDDRDRIQPNSGEKVLLIIEDDVHFAKVLMGLSRRKGFMCLAAGDGFSGLHLAKHYTPSAILLDLGLPDMNGLKVLDHLKYHSETRHIPVHIISGKDESAASLKKGAVGFLAKPITNEDLDTVYSRIDHVLNERIKKVLVVEDDANNQKAIHELLKNKKIEINSVYTGEEGLETLKSEEYDCVILDLTLPDMSGFDMLQTLVKQSDKTIPPIIINTGKDLSEEEYKELSQFTDSIVIKGVNSPERLLDEVSLFLHSVHKSLHPEQIQMIRNAHASDESLKGRKVLLVDDDLRNTFALSKILKQHGLEVVMADNGKMALEKLDSEQEVELVIMDIMMPIMDGYEAMRHIRKNPRFHKLPIIALTAKAMSGDREKSIEGGANDYMTKPVDTDKLLSLIRVWLFR